MADVTLADVSKVLGFNEKENHNGFNCYGTIVSEDTEAGTYNVSINRDPDTTVECTRFAGASVGDVVLVTVLPNGTATVTGCVGGDKDALEGKEIAKRVNQYFWHTVSGNDPGTHITEVPMEDFVENPVGGNTLITNKGISLRNGLRPIARFNGGEYPNIRLGGEGSKYTNITPESFSIFNEDNENIFDIHNSNRTVENVNDTTTNIWGITDTRSLTDEKYSVLNRSIYNEIDPNRFSLNCPFDDSLILQTNSKYDTFANACKSKMGVDLDNYGVVYIAIYSHIVNGGGILGAYSSLMLSYGYGEDGTSWSKEYVIYDKHYLGNNNWTKMITELNSAISQFGMNYKINAAGVTHFEGDSLVELYFNNPIRVTFRKVLGKRNNFEITANNPAFVKINGFSEVIDNSYQQPITYSLTITDTEILFEDSKMSGIINIETINNKEYYVLYIDAGRPGTHKNLILPLLTEFADDFHIQTILNGEIDAPELIVGNQSCDFILGCFEETTTENDIDKLLMDDFNSLQIRDDIFDDDNKLNVKKWMHEVNKKLFVEEGTNTNWKYRKWGNGTYEAWKEYQATGLTLTTASAGTYYGTSKTLPYPDFHKTLLNAQASEKASHSSGVFIYNLSGGENGLVIDYRSHASTTNASCGGFFYILGTYV